MLKPGGTLVLLGLPAEDIKAPVLQVVFGAKKVRIPCSCPGRCRWQVGSG
jgi:hypothetical protein